ncbi:MAG TPA: signal recognition particle-docking protein FtsY [Candidatus Nanoarchaeia archaeon]|nr:signal recognition particle-docking protein FtsY [Candidatus Nanoarchaeia archaeon]
MFKFLKDKLKQVVSRFSQQVKEEEAAEIVPPLPVSPPAPAAKPEQPPSLPMQEQAPAPRISPSPREQAHKPAAETAPAPAPKHPPAMPPPAQKKQQPSSPSPPPAAAPHPREEQQAPQRGIFQRITERFTKTVISSQKFDEFFTELEIALLESNVAIEVIEKIRDDLKQEIVDKQFARGKMEHIIAENLKKSIRELFAAPAIDLFARMREKKPFVICMVGVNGSGKTTAIAKLATLLQGKGKSVVFAAADTFRAASIEQLQEHATVLGVKVIRHDYGSDPAAVAFDAVSYARSRGIDAVLIDTAGRLHSNANLVDEMKKIIRVAKPDLTLFVGESITGNDCVEQARQFSEAIPVDGIILTKADIDEKGGAAVSVSYVTKKPILYLGTGQQYRDLQEFRPEMVTENLGLS